MFLDAEFGPAFLLFLLWTLLASVVLTVRPSGVRSPTEPVATSATRSSPEGPPVRRGQTDVHRIEAIVKSTPEPGMLEQAWSTATARPCAGPEPRDRRRRVVLPVNVFGESCFRRSRTREIVQLVPFLVYVAAYGLGALALVLALLGLGRLYRRRDEIRRAGSLGLRVAAAGAVLHALFAALYFATAAATGDAADAAFFHFGIGFLLLIGGSLTVGISVIRSRAQGRTGLMLLVIAAAAIVTIVTPALVHDLGSSFSTRPGSASASPCPAEGVHPFRWRGGNDRRDRRLAAALFQPAAGIGLAGDRGHRPAARRLGALAGRLAHRIHPKNGR
jgi:hypothetical protein